MLLSRRAATLVVGLVSVVWAINFFAGVVLPGYKSDPAINAIFMAIVGGALALGRKGAQDSGQAESRPRHRAEDGKKGDEST